MKSLVKWGLLTLLLLAVIISSSNLYDKLTEDRKGSNLELNNGFFDEFPNNDNANGEKGNVESPPQYGTTTPEVTTPEVTTPEITTPEPEKTFPSPDFTVLDENGNKVKLSDFRGKPIVLNFWATWCYYCKEEMPDFNRAYKNNPDVTFLMVNATDNSSETVSKAKKYVSDNGFSFPIFFDTEQKAINAYHVSGFPTTYFLDENGTIVARAVGMIDYDTLMTGIGMITN